jgi:hypothetical protein
MHVSSASTKFNYASEDSSSMESLTVSPERLNSYFGTAELSPEFLIAVRHILKFPEVTFESRVKLKRCNIHGDLVRVAYNNYPVHGAIAKNSDLLGFLCLSADSLYQFLRTHKPDFNKFVESLGCKDKIQWVENAASSNFADKLKEIGKFDINDTYGKKFRAAISYAQVLREECRHIPLSDEVTAILERLSVLNEFDRLPATRKLAGAHYKQTYEVLKKFFDEELKILKPIVETHIHFLREKPQNLESLYLCPGNFVRTKVLAPQGASLCTPLDLFTFSDSFRCVLEERLAKICPGVSLHIGVACFQKAAHAAAAKYRRDKLGHIVKRVAQVVGTVSRVAAIGF